MRILKNSIEVLFDNTPCFIHRDNVAGIKCYKNDNIYKLGEYRVAIYLIHPIDQIDDFEFGCNDAEPYIAWFDYERPSFPDPAPLGETLVDLLYATPKHICQCCRDSIASYVSVRPEFKNEYLCEVCYDAKIALASLDKEDNKNGNS